tara:strand:- start:17598 stop:22658 length:5061 start_codon:yes stop_codon:yes gene_type:complete
MACDTLNGRNEPCLDNISGIRNIYLINYEALPYEDITIVDGVITSINGNTPNAYKFEAVSTQNTFDAEGLTDRDNGSISWDSTNNLYLKKIRGVDYGTMDSIARLRPKVLIEYNNGVIRLFGAENGVTTNVSTLSGGGYNEFQGWFLQSVASERTLTPYIDDIEALGIIIVDNDTSDYPLISTSVSSLSGFSYYQGGGPSASQFYFVSGINIVGDVTVTAPTNFEISLDDITFTDSLSLSQTGGTLSATTVYVRMVSGLFTPANPVTGNIEHNAECAFTRKVSLSGSINLARIIVAPSLLFDFFYREGFGPSQSQVFQTSGEDLVGDITLSASTNYEISLTSGGTYVTSIVLTESGGIVLSTDIWVRLKAGFLAVNNPHNGVVELTSSMATDTYVTLEGLVTEPFLSVTPLLLTDFFYSETEGPSPSQSFEVTGLYLQSNVLISGDSKYEVSLTSGGTFTDTVSLVPVNGAVLTDVYTRLRAGFLHLDNPHNGIVTVSTPFFSDIQVICEGFVNPFGQGQAIFTRSVCTTPVAGPPIYPVQTWVAPAGVTSVSVVAIGGGGAGANTTGSGFGGNGAGLGWKNNIVVVPGQSYNVYPGCGGWIIGSDLSLTTTSGETSFFIDESTVAGFGGAPDGGLIPAGYIGDGGGFGGRGGVGTGNLNKNAGGGAGGYTGTGGAGGKGGSSSSPARIEDAASGNTGTGGAGGGGAGGNTRSDQGFGGGGGGTGAQGEFDSGAGGVQYISVDGVTGYGGDGGSRGEDGSPGLETGLRGRGGLYGGGGGGVKLGQQIDIQLGGSGAVRLIWGAGRSFPDTFAYDLPALPEISVTPLTLNRVAYIEGEGPSVAQSIVVDGLHLLSNVNISASTNYEISTTSGGTYSQTLSFPKTSTDLGGDNLSATTVYIRMIAGLLEVNSPFTGNTVISSDSVTSVTIPLIGDVIEPSLGTDSIFTTPGLQYFTPQSGVTEVSVVCIGAGGAGVGGSTGGNGGGGLGWTNNIPVVFGQSYELFVGSGAAGSPGQDSYFIDTSTVRGGGGGSSIADNTGGVGGTFTGDGGGNGGDGGSIGFFDFTKGGGGAGGYTGNGGLGGYALSSAPNPNEGILGAPGTGGAAGGGTGQRNAPGFAAGTGGGTDVYGEGASGLGGDYFSTVAARDGGTGSPDIGGAFGAPALAQTLSSSGGSSGAVRIIWGSGRSFPSSNVNSQPDITVVPSSLSGFTYIEGSGPSDFQTFVFSAVELSNSIVVTAGFNYEMALTTGSTYSSIVSLPQTGGILLPTDVHVRLKAGVGDGTYNELISYATDWNATQVTGTTAVFGVIEPVTVFVDPTSLSGFTYFEGFGPSTAQTISVSGTNISTDIIISGSASYEIGLTSGGTYSSSIVLPSSGSTVSLTDIWVRLKAGLLQLNNPFDENITVDAIGIDPIDVTLFGGLTGPLTVDTTILTVDSNLITVDATVWEAGELPNSLLTDLRAYYKMDETSGTVVSDATGNYDGTLVGSDFDWDVNGKISGGTTNSFSAGHGIDLGQSWSPGALGESSMNGWFKYDTVRSFNLLYSKTTTAIGVGDTFMLTYIESSGLLNYQMRSTAGIIWIQWSSFPVTTGVWNMITFTNDNSGLASGVKIYLNGVEYTTGRNVLADALGGVTGDNTGTPFSVGGYRANAEPWQFIGDIDEVAVWHKELTTDEITELYNTGSGVQYPF